MKKILTLLFTAFLAIAAAGQVDKMKDILDDEMDADNHTLRFSNALTGDAVKGARITIQDVGTFVTDAEGKIKFPRGEEEAIYLVNFAADGYITTDVSLEAVAGTIFNNRISVSPLMAMENMRIIVDWGRRPADLDAHLTKDKSYHISYRDKKVADDGEARLDRDDTDSWGPETITIRQVDTEGHYEFWVQDYTNRADENSRKLSKSKATVKVYGNNQLLELFNIPTDDRGNKWHVFTIDQGKIVPTNYVTAHE
jgi:hypothetical protein